MNLGDITIGQQSPEGGGYSMEVAAPLSFSTFYVLVVTHGTATTKNLVLYIY